jgi:hypothetical protein
MMRFVRSSVQISTWLAATGVWLKTSSIRANGANQQALVRRTVHHARDGDEPTDLRFVASQDDAVARWVGEHDSCRRNVVAQGAGHRLGRGALQTDQRGDHPLGVDRERPRNDRRPAAGLGQGDDLAVSAGDGQYREAAQVEDGVE